jgi:hypothetical protein
MLIEVGPGDRCPLAKQLPVLSFLGSAVEKARIPFPGDVELLSVGEVDLEMVGGDGDRGVFHGSASASWRWSKSVISGRYSSSQRQRYSIVDDSLASPSVISLSMLVPQTWMYSMRSASM